MTGSERIACASWLGTTDYRDVHSLQRRLQAGRRESGSTDTLLLTEHRPVFTLGQGHPAASLRVAPEVVAGYGIEVVQTERGGDITYHGQGQLVAYGIIDLKAWGLGVIDYVAGLEEVACGLLGDWSVRGERSFRGRGVWVDGRKIASVGVNVRHWVTMHGIAINVDPDMSHFALINPCGMSDAEMTSLAAEAGTRIGVEEVIEPFLRHFRRVFGCTVQIAGGASVPGGVQAGQSGPFGPSP